MQCNFIYYVSYQVPPRSYYESAAVPAPLNFTPPDPDKHYTLDEVPPTVSSPKDELMAHTTQVIRRKLERRQDEAVNRLSEQQQHDCASHVEAIPSASSPP